MKWSEYTEEQKEKYRAKAREYKKHNKDKINQQRKEYDKEYFKSLTPEQKEKRKEYNKKIRLKQKELKPVKIKNKVIKKIKPTYNETFIQKALLKHNGIYDYSFSNVINSKSKIKIKCSIHGLFKQIANDHLQGYGCPKCGGTSKLNTTNFIEKAINKHGNKYDYSLTEYFNIKTKVNIICPIHGLFEQTPNNHLNGKGCRNCGLENGTWQYHIWENKGLKSSNFDSFKVYIIECWNDTEKFYKIGKTFKTINSRFKGKQFMPYNYKVLNEYMGTAQEISILENELKNKHKEHSYKPKNKFNGMYECFNKIIFD